MDGSKKQKLEDIYALHAKSLYHYLLRMTGSPQVAEDLVQETFVRATISLSFYKNEQVKGWLFKVARHAYLDLWRKRQRWKWVPFFDGMEGLSSPYGEPESALMESEAKGGVEQMFRSLPEDYRTVIYLREHLDMSYKEIAESMDKNESQVKVTLHRARQRMRKLREERDGHNDGMDER
ncbi:sigma-70 family RNA polymerase sigma factor [Thalassobacillus hwangdonensis]|uniref:Sigma-70 family RNA polymerase sigma factor n=1 Tax=Thalassobacillus hwangdonensis TaxID=546108 RepID=A0ABW3L4V6_9BACI